MAVSQVRAIDSEGEDSSQRDSVASYLASLGLEFLLGFVSFMIAGLADGCLFGCQNSVNLRQRRLNGISFDMTS